MRSTLARIIAVAAVLPLIPAALRFFDSTRVAYQFDNISMQGGAWLTLGDALLAPLGLFALAAVVEMLFRIAASLPPTSPPAASQRQVAGGWPWRNPVANALLVVAALAYLASGLAAWSYTERGVVGALEMAHEQRAELIVYLWFYWLTNPLQIIAWAAVIEYLSRISAVFSTRRDALK